MGITSWDERYKKNLAAYQTDMNSDINEIKANAAKNSETVTKLYEGKIADANELYEDDLRENEVQKYINAREVAENNANLGLTDSGLNRTQQTAVQLSASNNDAKIRRQRQSAVDELKRLMTSDLAEIENERYSSEKSIRDTYKQMASQAATDTYKADLEAAEKRVETESKGVYANGIWTNTGTKDESDNPVWRSSDGKTQSFAKGVNPYTGTVNDDIYNGANTDNGYQPDNINGTTLKNTGVSTDITGKTQAIWTANGKYYVWYDNLNKYVEKTSEELGAENLPELPNTSLYTNDDTDEPISVKEFDRKIYNKNIEANNGKSYINPIVTYLESQYANEGRTFNAQDFLVEMTANSFITPEECSLLLYRFHNRTLDAMYDK